MALHRFLACVSVLCIVAVPGAARALGAYPTAAEVADILHKEPITPATWPAWKERLTRWFGDRTRQTDAAYRAAEQFCAGQADASHQLPPAYDNDSLAWYFLGGSILFGKPAADRLPAAEAAYRRCLRIDPSFSRGHRNLALVLAFQAQTDKGRVALPNASPLAEAERELAEARRLDPTLPVAGVASTIAVAKGRYDEAERLLHLDLAEHPEDLSTAQQLAQIVVTNPQAPGKAADRTTPLVRRFPDDGTLVTLHALALALDNRVTEAAEQLRKARALGTTPEDIISATVVTQIEEAAAPGWLERGLWVMLYFAVFYAAAMLLMAGAGLVLALGTRGSAALGLLTQVPPEERVAAGGQVIRAHSETLLARFYGLALMVGLVLFYVAIPFVIVGVLGLTAGLLYLIFMAPRIPVKLVLIVVVVGCVSAWAVFKSLFTQPSGGAFGLPKSAEECPRVHQLLGEVAKRVDTDPVDEVYIAPGAAIGVHQEGRGPFGIFGTKRRVLTLGLSTIRFLTIGELKAILAHEYAHFSHQDTFYSRFIYQVHVSIEHALHGMLSAGGMYTYANPFYWFLWLYYKCYSLLSAGYSRSREFLADRMAATLYGSDQFSRALAKVCTDGTLFEMTIYDHIRGLLNEQKAFVNMYQAFQEYRDQKLSKEARDELYQKLLGEKGSLFASHPTFSERMEAVGVLPATAEPDGRPALELFDRPDDLEQELTKFLTDYLAYIHYLQQAAIAT